jgi:hypothetical protein
LPSQHWLLCFPLWPPSRLARRPPKSIPSRRPGNARPVAAVSSRTPRSFWTGPITRSMRSIALLRFVRLLPA